MRDSQTGFAPNYDDDDSPEPSKQNQTGEAEETPDAPVQISDKSQRLGLDENEIEDERAIASRIEDPAELEIEEGGEQTVDLEALRTVSSRATIHSVFSQREKRYIIFMTAWAGFFSPVSANIYYPALNSLASDLDVSDSLINLTLTSYMIFQGLAPTIFGDFADVAGRRPAYMIGFSIYLCANIGLALQTNYAALFVLRCVQSTGSSATIAIAYGIVADISTSAERGSYAGIVTAGMMMGPSLGPVIGGVLAEFLGWRAIFWFLAIMCAVFLVPFCITFPETSRNVVGNGSIPPQGWNMSLLNYLQLRKQSKMADDTLNRTSTREQQRVAQANLAFKRKSKMPNPLHVIHIILEKEVGFLLLYNSIIYIAFMDIAASLPFIFARNYNYNALQIGLCFLPYGTGSSLAAFVNGRLLDLNYRRLAKKHGISTSRRRQVDLRKFPLERARLELAVPMLFIGVASLLVYGWILEKNVHIAGPLVVLFFLGYFITGSFNVLSTLLVDLNPKSPATATAANNLVRCLVGAGATAVIVPMINAMGKGWTFTAIAGLLLVTSPIMLALWVWGEGWREEKRVRMENEEEKRAARMAEDLSAESRVEEKRPREESSGVGVGTGEKDTR